MVIINNKNNILKKLIFSIVYYSSDQESINKLKLSSGYSLDIMYNECLNTLNDLKRKD